MTLKPSFLNTDFRHHQLVLSFLPFLIWAAAATVAIAFWHHPLGATAALSLFSLGGFIAMKAPSFNYALASRSLRAPMHGTPGKDFLFFHAEAPETFHRLKLLPDDAGFLRIENGCFRITTLEHDFTISVEALHYEPILRNDCVRALLLRFQPAGTRDVVRIAAVFGYFGNDMKVAADRNLTCKWASGVIEAMIESDAARQIIPSGVHSVA
jgi:hypothetical protein